MAFSYFKWKEDDHMNNSDASQPSESFVYNSVDNPVATS